MWFKNGLGASALYLSLRPVTVSSGRVGQNFRKFSKEFISIMMQKDE